MAMQYTDNAGDVWIVSEEARFSPAMTVRPGEPIPEATSAMLVFERVRDGARRVANNAPLDWQRSNALPRIFVAARRIGDS